MEKLKDWHAPGWKLKKCSDWNVQNCDHWMLVCTSSISQYIFQRLKKVQKTSRGIIGAKKMGLKCSEPVEHCFPPKTSWESEIMQIVNKMIDLKLNDSIVYPAIPKANRWLL